MGARCAGIDTRCRSRCSAGVSNDLERTRDPPAIADLTQVARLVRVGRSAGRSLATYGSRKAADLAQRSIEILIGRLTTDEAFRSAYRGDAMKTLTGFIEVGYELTAVEIAAVRATPPEVWEYVAEQIDPRIQKVSFTR